MTSKKRAKQIVIWAALIFLAIQLGIGVALDASPLGVRFTDGARLLGKLFSEEVPAEVVFLGSSRFQTSIRKRVIDETLQQERGADAAPIGLLAVVAGDIVSSSFLFDEMISRGHRPRFAVIEVTPEWLVTPPHYIDIQLARFFGWPEVLHWLPDLMVREKDKLARARFLPAYHQRQELLEWMIGTSPPYLVAPSPSADPKAEAVPTPAGPGKGVERWAGRLVAYPLSERVIATLEGLLARCAAERVQCILLEPPVSAPHRAIYDAEVRTQYRGVLSRLEQTYQVPYVDFSAGAPDNEFQDSSHLELAGGRRFSERLTREFVGPLLYGGESPE